MSKITEERMREIIELQLNANVTNFSDYECGELVALDISDFENVLNGITLHPEIKSLFDVKEDWDSGEKHIELIKSLDYQCGGCLSVVNNCKSNYCGFCGKKLTWPIPESPISNIDKIDGAVLKELAEVEPPAPVAEYEIKEIFTTHLGVGFEENKYCTKEVGKIGGAWCRNKCFTNSLQNFAGHEVEMKSIRCAHRFNQEVSDNGQ